MTKLKKGVKILSDGDVILLDSKVKNIINRCCNCGALHHIRIDRSKNIIRMSWNRIYPNTNKQGGST